MRRVFLLCVAAAAAAAAAAGGDSSQWQIQPDQVLLGVPGTWDGLETLHPDRLTDALQSSSCNCNQQGCGCSSNLYCASSGLCYSCSQYNCNNRPVGCGCGSGLYCSSATGQCQATCNCSPGWVCGSDGRCQHPDTCKNLQCSGYGAPMWTGTSCTCSCNTGYTGSSCSQCGVAYSGYPHCSSQANCNGYACGNRGSPYYQGAACACVCQPGYSGPSCSVCAAGYAGYPNCATSSQAQACTTSTCSSKGTAVWSVSVNSCVCTCSNGYGGRRCDVCAVGYTGYPHCVPVGTGTGGVNPGVGCSTVFCSNHGVAYWDGRECRCTCGQGFGGVKCDTCLPGYYNYPTCAGGSSPNGWSATVSPSPPPQVANTVYRTSDDDLPAGIIAVIVIIAVALVAAGIVAVILTRKSRAKEKEQQQQQYAYPHKDEPPVSPPPKYAGMPEQHVPMQANPISSMFSPPPVV